MNIPRFVSRTPPPLPDNDEEDEDEEFGNYVIGGITENGTGSSFVDGDEDPDAAEYSNVFPQHTDPSIKKPLSTSVIIRVEDQKFEPSSSSPPPQPTKDNNFTVAFQLESEVTNSSVFSCDNGLPELLDNDGFEEGNFQSAEDSSLYETVLNNHNSTEGYASDEGLKSVTHIDVDNLPSSFVESVTAASSSANGPPEIESDNLVLRNEREEDIGSISSESPSFTEFSSIGISDGINAFPSVESANKLTSELPTCQDDSTGEREDYYKCIQLSANEEDEFSEFADFQTNDEWQNSITSHEINPVDEIGTHAQMLNIEGVHFDPSLLESINGNSIWSCLRFLEDTPALKYQWLSSASNYKLLSALKIDSRNIFCGPWSKAMKNKCDEGNLKAYSPRSGVFPFGEGPNVHHDSCHLSSSTDWRTAVPNAHFDWEGSGLVNPFDFPKDDQIQILQCDIGSVTETPLSSEALHIIQSLPDLSYMTKTYLIFKKLPTSQ